MYVIGAFKFTQHVSDVRREWSQARGKSKDIILGRVTPKFHGDILGGEVFLFDTDQPDGKLKLLSRIPIRTPMGLYYDSVQETLLIGSSHSINCLSYGKIIAQLENHLFNSIHWLAPSNRGHDFLWIVSTGIDAILEINIRTGQLFSSWFATENGYHFTRNGAQRTILSWKNYSGMTFPIPDQTTHINSVLDTGKYLLATLFHQGVIIEIDRDIGSVKEVLHGLNQPHALRTAHYGRYMFCDTNAPRVVIMDHQYHFLQSIEGNLDWIHDAVFLADDSLLIADSNHHRLLLYDATNQSILREFRFSDEKLIGSILPVTPEQAKKIFG